MIIHIIAVGTRMPGWVDEACEAYARRMPRECRLQLHPVAAEKRTRKSDLGKLLKTEGERLLARIPAGSRIIALERSGRDLDTDELAGHMRTWLAENIHPAFLIGGPEGLPPACLERAESVWSLSRLTLAHPLVRVVLAEQLYRAWSMVRGLPYHRGS